MAITVNKSQTTRTLIRAIVNRPNAQIVFIDTPGIHKPKTKLSEAMVETSFGTMKGVDLILFMIDAASSEIGKGDRIILDKIREANQKTILIINKIDLIQKENLLSLMEQYRQEYEFLSIIPIAAVKNKYKDRILDEIEKNIPCGPAYYNIDEYTDQTARQLVEEVIREKALSLLDQEVPHGLFVEVEKMSKKKTMQNEDIYQIEAVIFCLRKSHKGIIIGKEGSMLKRIGTNARHDLEKMLGIKINLKLWVKIKEDWQDNESIVKKFRMT